MALRALDNGLPAAVADQRRRRLPSCSPRRPPSPSPAPPPGAEPAVEYVRSEDLLPVPGPKARAAGLVAGLDSRDWVMVCEALNDARRLAIHHPALLSPILEKVVLGIVKTMKNPRSAVLKTSVMACTDGFAAFGNLSLSSSLSKAMHAMATSMPPLPLLRKLKAYVHHTNLRGHNAGAGRQASTHGFVNWLGCVLGRLGWMRMMATRV